MAAEQAPAEVADIMEALVLIDRQHQQLQDALGILPRDVGILALGMPEQALPVGLDVAPVEGDQPGAVHPAIGAEDGEPVRLFRKRLVAVGFTAPEDLKPRGIVK